MTAEKIIEAMQTINNEIEPELKFSERGRILKKILANNLKATVLNDDTINMVVSEFNKYTKIINELENKSLLSTFRDNINNELWYELPFCYYKED